MRLKLHSCTSTLGGFLGGMGGNAMIGLSTINVLNGGRGRMAPSLGKLGSIPENGLLCSLIFVGAY